MKSKMYLLILNGITCFIHDLLHILYGQHLASGKKKNIDIAVKVKLTSTLY